MTTKWAWVSQHDLDGFDTVGTVTYDTADEAIESQRQVWHSADMTLEEITAHSGLFLARVKVVTKIVSVMR